MKPPTIWTAAAFATAFALTMTACSEQDEANTGAISQALETTTQHVRHRRMHRPILRLTEDIALSQPGQTVAGLIDELAKLVSERIPCAALEVGTTSLGIAFGDLGDDCQYEGVLYAGTLVIEISEGREGMQLRIVYDLFGNDEFSLRGHLDVIAAAGGRHILGELTMERGDLARELQIDRHERDVVVDDVIYGVQVDGLVSMTSERGAVERTMQAVVVREGDTIPESGQVQMQKLGSGYTRQLTFMRADENNITVTMHSAHGDHTVTVPADGSWHDLAHKKSHHKR